MADIALFDVAGTALVGFGISLLLRTSFLVVFLVLLVIGIGTHYIFEIPTALNYYLGLNDAVDRVQS
jgi:hypothetical protein